MAGSEVVGGWWSNYSHVVIGKMFGSVKLLHTALKISP